MMKQKDAVVEAVVTVLGDSFVAGETVVKEAATKEQKAEIRSLVLDGILAGTVGFGGNVEDESTVSRYVNSMVDNHFRKAKELNGNTPYKPSSTGTRRDPQLKELNKLLKLHAEGTDEHQQIVDHINTRNTQLDQLRAEKRSAAAIGTINADVLPPHLRDLVSNSSSETAEATV